MVGHDKRHARGARGAHVGHLPDGRQVLALGLRSAVMTLALAIIGALTGVVALAAQVWQFTASGPRVKVSASNAISTDDGRAHLSIDLTNVGRIPATINEVGILVERPGSPGFRRMPMVELGSAYWSGPPLPYRLIDGESTTYFLFPVAISLGLSGKNARQDIRVYARLATDKLIKSRNRIDIKALADLYESGPSKP